VIKSLNYLVYTKLTLSYHKNKVLFVILIVGVFGSLLTPVLSVDFASATSEEGGDTGGGDGGGGDNAGGGDESDPEPEPEPNPSPNPGLAPGPEPSVDPCLENPQAEGCTPPVDPCIENPNAQGCEPTPTPPANLITPTPRVPEPPDDDCLYDPSLPKCAPINGKCPEGFNMNEAGQCYPDKPCLPGYARADNDESGACLPLLPTTPPPGGNCHPSYPNSCIPPPPPDRNCGDPGIPDNVKVVPPDSHRLDGDKDGIGCEGGGGNGGNQNNDGGSTSTTECQGQADCFRGTVTEIVDGDTLDINNVRVRLALVNTPESGQSGYTEAIDFVQSVCGVRTTALVDEDDGQKEGSFDRMIGLVYCGNDNINNKKSLNDLLLEGGYAVIYQDFCGISEFASASWARSRGC
jgi:Staphylococcal nuclease homologue